MTKPMIMYGAREKQTKLNIDRQFLNIKLKHTYRNAGIQTQWNQVIIHPESIFTYRILLFVVPIQNNVCIKMWIWVCIQYFGFSMSHWVKIHLNHLGLAGRLEGLNFGKSSNPPTPPTHRESTLSNIYQWKLIN